MAAPSSVAFHLHSRKRWFNKGLWAITDQGLFSASSFMLNIMLARWLTPREYGAFTVAFTIFLLLGMFHAALLTEPMLVFGPGKYRNRIPQYLGTLVSGHANLVVLGGLLIALAAALMRLWGISAVPSALAALALTAPFILLLWLMRSACYLLLAPNLAAAGGLMNLILVGVGLIVLYQHRWLSTVSALGVMGFASLVTGAGLAVSLRMGSPPLTVNALVRETFTDHWGYGRWAVATMALSWLPGSVYYLLLPMWRGLEASAGLKAMMNFVLPVLNLNTALSALLVPALVRARGSETRRRDLTSLILIAVTAGSAGYWLFLTMFRRPLMMWMYRGQYTEPVGMWYLLLVILIATGIVNVLGSALRALERPDQIFRANMHSTAVALTVGVWCTFRWGVLGAGVGLAMSSMVRALGIWRLYRETSNPGLTGRLFVRPMRADPPHPVLSRFLTLLQSAWR